MQKHQYVICKHTRGQEDYPHFKISATLLLSQCEKHAKSKHGLGNIIFYSYYVHRLVLTSFTNNGLTKSHDQTSTAISGNAFAEPSCQKFSHLSVFHKVQEINTYSA